MRTHSKEWTAIMYNVLAALTMQKHDELINTPFYSHKVKQTGNLFLKELEKVIYKINSQKNVLGETPETYEGAMKEYSQLFDSFNLWFEAWQKFIQLPSDEQIKRSEEIENILNRK